ncbi:hypothetical protein [Pseudonocardia asaccharolytica]|uniref:Uncharacterized protein n=1 Tax=Pseudonocardia asaccharolytica DSM 44247 = NBRC 16224 TaxID=1123024 RepID=A0A511D8K9_9PSEU|nr:hypothetical protein [Pseudonocardia asaccharolytica]GEL20947.1 hypothetical protein PA7_47840 [Pseudonocardia asaccharolytica DSM 44247 = NBRC 16224]
MLLLVLILVMIAFGLLVVALLSGSVLWAWVSVAVSVGAAGVLLVDWMQRRAAVKAGADAGRSVPPQIPTAIAEPATEIIPIVPAGGPAPGAPAGAGHGGSGRGDDPEVDASASEATTVLPVIQPPGSADRPSGAGEDIIPSGIFSSPSVTESCVDVPGPGVGAAAEPEASESGPAADRPAEPGADDESRTSAPAVAGSAADPSSNGASAGGAPKADLGAEEIDGPTLAVAPASSAGPAAGQEAPDAPDAGEVPKQPAATTQVRAGDPPMAQSERWRGPQNGPPPPDLRRGTPQDARGGLPPPLGPGGEPPEEPRNADAAALVAELEDEVVVVDELPRYHLAGCRSLPGKPIIPLPVREAVELGFTPCGWCTPDRVLSGRHPAQVR